jgi:hypothetical protein
MGTAENVHEPDGVYGQLHAAAVLLPDEEYLKTFGYKVS